MVKARNEKGELLEAQGRMFERTTYVWTQDACKNTLTRVNE